MSLIARMDLALLVRTDAFVGWNRDRGRADQWMLARACLDIAMALVVAAFLVEAATTPRFSPFAQMGYIVIAFVFGYLRAREIRSISRLSAMADGARQARLGEQNMRQTNLLVMACLLALCAFGFDTSDIPFIAGVAAMGATSYFKAAEPPPPSPRRDEALATVG